MKVWLPMNPITEKLFYVNANGNKKNQRIIMSAPTDTPIVWQISKVENSSPFGLQKLTLAQDFFDDNADFIDKEEQANGDLFAMYANYYSSTIKPEEDKEDNTQSIRCVISCNDNKIKVNGSYKLLTVTYYDEDNNDVTNDYIDLITPDCWTCSIGNNDFTSNDLITWSEQNVLANQMRIKFGNDRSYLTNILTVQCAFNINDVNVTGEIQLEIVAL